MKLKMKSKRSSYLYISSDGKNSNKICFWCYVKRFPCQITEAVTEINDQNGENINNLHSS